MFNQNEQLKNSIMNLESKLQNEKLNSIRLNIENGQCKNGV